MNDALDHARLAYERAGRGCIVSLFKGEVRYATMAELVARLGPEADSLMFLTAISDAVERYNPETEAVVLIESGTRVLDPLRALHAVVLQEGE